MAQINEQKIAAKIYFNVYLLNLEFLSFPQKICISAVTRLTDTGSKGHESSKGSILGWECSTTEHLPKSVCGPAPIPSTAQTSKQNLVSLNLLFKKTYFIFPLSPEYL